jgi:hypothetical protein
MSEREALGCKEQFAEARGQPGAIASGRLLVEAHMPPRDRGRRRVGRVRSSEGHAVSEHVANVRPSGELVRVKKFAQSNSERLTSRLSSKAVAQLSKADLSLLCFG